MTLTQGTPLAFTNLIPVASDGTTPRFSTGLTGAQPLGGSDAVAMASDGSAGDAAPTPVLNGSQAYLAQQANTKKLKKYALYGGIGLGAVGLLVLAIEAL